MPSSSTRSTKTCLKCSLSKYVRLQSTFLFLFRPLADYLLAFLTQLELTVVECSYVHISLSCFSSISMKIFHFPVLAPKGGWGWLMLFLSCLASQGCHLITHSYLLSRFCLIVVLLFSALASQGCHLITQSCLLSLFCLTVVSLCLLLFCCCFFSCFFCLVIFVLQVQSPDLVFSGKSSNIFR